MGFDPSKAAELYARATRSPPASAVDSSNSYVAPCEVFQQRRDVLRGSGVGLDQGQHVQRPDRLEHRREGLAVGGIVGAVGHVPGGDAQERAGGGWMRLEPTVRPTRAVRNDSRHTSQ